MFKILLVEDDKSISGVYEKAFRLDNQQVFLAENGIEGLEQLKKHDLDIILLDLMMPKMSGMDFLKRVKSNQATKDIPVVILSNLAGDNNEKYGLSQGAVKYIVKSDLDPKEVVEIVKKILTKKTKK